MNKKEYLDFHAKLYDKVVEAKNKPARVKPDYNCHSRLEDFDDETQQDIEAHIKIFKRTATWNY